MRDQKIQQYTLLFHDCLSAIAHPLQKLRNSLANQRQIIQKTFDTSLPKVMSVIEQETDREGEEQIVNNQISDLKHSFNIYVGQLIEAHKQMDEVINFYKSEMQELAKQLVKQVEKYRKISQEKDEGKISKRKKSQSGKSLIVQKEEDEELKARPAPCPVPQGGCQNCIIQIQKLQALQKERSTWKTLSAKIDDCKKKINNYEAEIKEKDNQLVSLREKLINSQSREKNDKEEEEKRRLKNDNTKLRGQKVLLSNQLAAVRRQLAEKTSIAEVQEAEVLRLRLQIDNLSSSLNWHSSNLNQLRMGVTKQRNQQWMQVSQRVDILVRVNKALEKSLKEQEQALLDFNQKSKRIEQGWNKQNQKHQKKIAELQAILDDKNETIIRLKTGGKGQKGDRGGGYHADMVKVLNKRLAESEQRVRVLQDTLARVTQAQ